jgi:hypothetical protein
MGLRELMTPEDRAREDRWAKEIKYYAARYAWSRQTQRTRKGGTWADWFERRFGESLNEFAERHRKDRTAQPQSNE